MARPRLSLNLRFKDIIPIWDAVERDDGGAIACASTNDAIALVYRLNQYRKLLRESADLGTTMLDAFVIRRHDDQVVIEPRPTFDLSRMTKLDGTPISPPITQRQLTAEDRKLVEEAERLMQGYKAPKGSFVE